MANERKLAQKVASLLRGLADQIEDNPNFLTGLNLDSADVPAVGKKEEIKDSSELDVLKILVEEGPESLKEKLIVLELKELKKIIEQHGLDPAKVAAKWRKKEKLINLILEKLAVGK